MAQCHVVTFRFPAGDPEGECDTIVRERIDSWDLKKAMSIAEELAECFEKHPDSFSFSTLECDDDGEEGRVLAVGGTYFIDWESPLKKGDHIIRKDGTIIR